MKNKTLSINDTDIHYFTRNRKDKETILFLHPAFSDHTCFDSQINFFSEHYNVITIDMIGHGLSSIGKSKDKIDSSADHINQILISENIDRIHVVGVSMGSLIAQYFALRYPEKTQTLTAVGGYDINHIYPEINKAQRNAIISWIFKALFSFDSFRKYTAAVSVAKEESKTKFYRSTKGFSRKSFMTMAGLGNVIKERESYSRTFPMMILTGEQDSELALKTAHKWYNSDPKSIHHIISDAGHCANMDNPDEFNYVVFDFINQNKTVSSYR